MVSADISGTECEIGLPFLHTWVFKILDNTCYNTQQQSLFNWGKWWCGCSGRKKLNCGMNSWLNLLSLRCLLSFPLYAFLHPIPDSSFPGTHSLLSPVLTTLVCFFPPLHYYPVRFLFYFALILDSACSLMNLLLEPGQKFKISSFSNYSSFLFSKMQSTWWLGFDILYDM